MKTFLDDNYTFLHLGYESDHSTINGIVDNLLSIAENNFDMYKAMHKNDPDLDVSECSDVDGNYIRLVYEHRLNQLYWGKLFAEFDICNKVCFENIRNYVVSIILMVND